MSEYINKNGPNFQSERLNTSNIKELENNSDNENVDSNVITINNTTAVKPSEITDLLKLRNEVLSFVKKIIIFVLGFCFLVFAIDIIYFLFKGEHLYSEWFLATVLGSQVVVLPLLLLRIIVSSLFPKANILDR